MPVALSPRRPARHPAARILAVAATALLAGCGDDDDGDDLTGPGDGTARGVSVFGVDAQNTLVVFGAGNPTRPAARTVAITGLQSGETVVGLDFRANAAAAADRRLYGVTSASRVVTVDTTTGVATPVAATPFTPAVTGTAFGVDFNPTADRVRLHTDQDQDLRLNQLTGAVAAVDTALTYAAGDAGAGQNPTVVGTAYTNPGPGATSTALYAIDSDRDVLATLASPNSGRMTTVGALGVNTTTAVGFDVATSGTAYATLTTTGASRSRLYTVNLATGAATAVGDVNFGRPLVGIAVAP